MNLEEAIKILKSLKSSRWFEYAGGRGKKILSDEEDNAIDAVLTALGRLSQENEELKQKINDFVEEMRCME